MYSVTYLFTYLPIYLLPHSFGTYLITYLFTYLPTYLLTHSFGYLLTYLFTFSFIRLLTYPLIYLLTYLPTYLLTYSFIRLLTYLLTYLPTFALFMRRPTVVTLPTVKWREHPCLIWLGIEKLIYPSWAILLVDEHPILALGLNHEFFVVAAAFVEISLGFMIMACL